MLLTCSNNFLNSILLALSSKTGQSSLQPTNFVNLFVNKYGNCSFPKPSVLKSAFTSSFILIFLCCFSFVSYAQVSPPPPPQDTSLRIIQIIQGQRLREKSLDSATSIQTIAGKVILKEGLTTFYCDSAVINKSTNILEAYGNIHINQNDSIHTYSQTLRYIGNDRVAYLKKDVRLTDNKGILYTQDLEYDLKTSIGKYKNGGRVVNGKTVLTSTEGVYYADTKDVYFKRNVHLVDPKYDFKNDTMLYNTQTQVSSWTTPTVIKSKNGGDIYSSNGTYDLKNGQAFFGERTVIKDSTRTYVADNSAYDEKTGIAQLEGNAIIKDSVNGYSVLGGQVYLNKNDNSFLATRKPVLIFKGEAQDSTFIAADTLFSGVDKVDKDGKRIVVRKDTLKKETVVSAQDSAVVIKDSNETKRNRRSQFTDSLANKLAESKTTLPDLNDSIAVVMKDNRTDTSLTTPLASIGDSLGKRRIMMDSLSGLGGRTDTLNVRDTAGKKLAHDPADSTIRYFIAFHNVRIFNDSVQSVCDSLYYTSEDSIFR